jgi:hypothetical protein
MYENKVISSIFGPKRQEVIGGWVAGSSRYKDILITVVYPDS